MKQSAGLLVYRRRGTRIQVLLVHPGGPFWARRDEGAWSIPKGEFDPREDPLAAAKREVREETGLSFGGPFLALTSRKMRSGKIVRVWAAEGDADVSKMESNLFPMEWPPHSGRMREFPEVDRAGWFSIAAARKKLLKGQVPFLDELGDALRTAHRVGVGKTRRPPVGRSLRAQKIGKIKIGKIKIRKMK
jgi:predicted NUDIX family NTP pyrophosphohydrolase